MLEPVSGSCQDEDEQHNTVCGMACIAEIPQQTGKSPQVHDIGIVVVEPATGEAIFDSFTDLPNRSELEKRLNHLRPVEIIISTNISTATEHLLSSRSGRIERLPASSFELTEATSLTSDFLTDESRLGELSPCVVQALGALISHLREFRLTKALSPSRLKPFTTRGKILQLDAGTVKNLEIFETDLRKNKGSLAWVLDHTKTSFGSRLLKRWVSQPLCSLEPLVERQDAVGELLRPEVSEIVEHLRGINTAGFASLVSCMTGLFHDLKSREIMIWSTFSNGYVETLLTQTMENLQGVVAYQANLNLEAAKSGDKTKLLNDWSNFPEVETQLDAIKNLNCKLHQLRGKIAKSLGMFSVNYTTPSAILAAISAIGQAFDIDIKL
ncbi:hypothetical protein B566_EDAN016672 [Ephemera danica]|nr:hypothetical protein B566_EDAN016672 [Ephemera danica]